MDDLDDLLDSKFYFCGFFVCINFVDLISTIFIKNKGALEEYETVSSTPLNEASTNNNYTIANQGNLNRYSGTDKLDNSKRMNYGFNISKNKFSGDFSQSYEFTPDSNYNKAIGNNYYLSDALVESSKIFK